MIFHWPHPILPGYRNGLLCLLDPISFLRKFFFIHCLLLLFSLAGISRSVTMSAVYIISVTGLSVAEALQAIRSSRTIANPNFGFQKQLHDFEVNGGAQKVSQTPARVMRKILSKIQTDTVVFFM